MYFVVGIHKVQNWKLCKVDDSSLSQMKSTRRSQSWIKLEKLNALTLPNYMFSFEKASMDVAMRSIWPLHSELLNSPMNLHFKRKVLFWTALPTILNSNSQQLARQVSWSGGTSPWEWMLCHSKAGQNVQTLAGTSLLLDREEYQTILNCREFQVLTGPGRQHGLYLAFHLQVFGP